MSQPNREYLRSTIFGIEDSLVSTTGLIVGLSIGGASQEVVILGASVAIAIEAVSMAAGEYLSDDAVKDIDKLKRHRDKPAISGLLMFISYLLAGLVPLLPVFFLDYPNSVWLSVVLALVGLFLLGYFKGVIVHTGRLRGALKIMVVGGLATTIGLIVGLAFEVSA